MFVQMRTLTKKIRMQYNKGIVRSTDGKVLPLLYN